MGKFDQAFKKAKAKGMINHSRREQEKKEPLPNADKDIYSPGHENSSALQDHDIYSTGKATLPEDPEPNGINAGGHELFETKPQNGLVKPASERSADNNKIVMHQVESFTNNEHVDELIQREEKTLDITVDRDKIARNLIALRAHHNKTFSSGDSERKSKFKKEKSSKNATMLVHPSSHFAEYFRVIRTYILYKAKKKNARVFLVTSSMPGEGKSFVASNLAVSIAQGLDKSVLLIDADFRKPTIHTTFGLGNTKGLSDFLGDENYHLDTLVQKTSIPQLSILPAGSCIEGSSELLASEVMKVFLQHIKYEDEGRDIILDGPPNRISETVALTKVVDSTLLVVKAGSTDKRETKRAVDNIGPNNILGVVLNYSSSKMNHYYSYYKKSK